jgi:hypothetical protein
VDGGGTPADVFHPIIRITQPWRSPQRYSCGAGAAVTRGGTADFFI